MLRWVSETETLVYDLTQVTQGITRHRGDESSMTIQKDDQTLHFKGCHLKVRDIFTGDINELENRIRLGFEFIAPSHEKFTAYEAHRYPPFYFKLMTIQKQSVLEIEFTALYKEIPQGLMMPFSTEA